MTTLDDAPLTRREFQAFREESRQDSQALREEMRQSLQAFREEMRQTLQYYATKADLAEMKVELVKWMVGTVATSIAIGSTVIFVVLRLTAS